jgi:hypothetical protein
MVRALAILALSIFAPIVLFADAYDDLVKVQTAFQNAKSWHAEEHFSNGKTTIVEYSAPDRWRIQPSPDVTQLVIGNDVYTVHNGHSTKLPFGGGMIRKIIENVGLSVKDEIKQSARDLGMQTLEGQSVHVYSYTSRDVPVTLYVGADMLPVQSVVNDKKTTTTIKYSKFNASISIEAQ